MEALTQATVVKEGWINKRGEFIKNWRPRWFQLKSDGTFRGFKTGPPAPSEPVINYFDVAGSVLTPTEDGKGKSKKFGFNMRFMQMTRFAERAFMLDSEGERDEWVRAYADVKKRVMAQVTAAPSQSSVKRKTVTIEDFDMLSVLGRGTFGKVMLAREKATKEIFAIKILKKDVILAKDELAHTMTESQVLQNTNHPFLTTLKYTFQSADALFFVMEYVNGGELFFHLSHEKKFSEERTKFYMAEISLAIWYLHDRGIIYRDLKLENLLLDRFGHIKITDFGLCKEEITFGSTTTTFCGTPEYLAPEILEDNDYGRAVDWWGVGVVMFEMMCGHLPFYNKNHEVLFELILHEEPKIPVDLSSKARDCLSQLLIKDPRKRLGGSERDGRDVTEHPFFGSIDFKALFDRKIPAPFVPTVASAEDVRNFDKTFTSEAAQLTPPDKPIGGQVADDPFSSFAQVAK